MPTCRRLHSSVAFFSAHRSDSFSMRKVSSSACSACAAALIFFISSLAAASFAMSASRSTHTRSSSFAFSVRANVQILSISSLMEASSRWVDSFARRAASSSSPVPASASRSARRRPISACALRSLAVRSSISIARLWRRVSMAKRLENDRFCLRPDSNRLLDRLTDHVQPLHFGDKFCVPCRGVEPLSSRLKVECATNYANRAEKNEGDTPQGIEPYTHVHSVSTQRMSLCVLVRGSIHRQTGQIKK
jgi:hypothetical protein